MSEVLFYHLERQTLEQALPLLLGATLKRGWKAVVQAGSETRMQALDSHLWSYKDDAFLPHAAKGDARFAEHAAEQPIWLTDEENVTRARARWAELKDAGHELTYWQQSAEGKWEQKA